jgi:hypothetical protein
MQKFRQQALQPKKQESPIWKVLKFSFLYFNYPGTADASFTKAVVVKRVK